MALPKSVGMRTIKTGIAVVITLYIGNTILISNPFYAVIGTIFAMQNTVKSSFVAGKNRILGTILGGIVGYIFAALALKSPLFISLAIILTIYCCNSLKLNASIIIASTITVSILLGITDQDPLHYSIFRTIDTSIGIVIGILVNYYIAQPNYFQDLVKEVSTIEDMTKVFVKNLLIHECPDRKQLKSEISRLDFIFQNYKADTQFDRNPIDDQLIRIPMEACHEIYFHSKCIGLLSVEDTVLTEENKQIIINYFQNDFSSTELKSLTEPINPIFHYHIEKLLIELNLLHESVEELGSHAKHLQKKKSWFLQKK